MGYQYHQKRCGRDLSEEQKPVFLYQHCGKTYRSKAGRDYHIRTEHPPTATATATATTATATAATNSHNNNNNEEEGGTTDTNNNTGKERVRLGAVLFRVSYHVLKVCGLEMLAGMSRITAAFTLSGVFREASIPPPPPISKCDIVHTTSFPKKLSFTSTRVNTPSSAVITMTKHLGSSVGRRMKPSANQNPQNPVPP